MRAREKGSAERAGAVAVVHESTSYKHINNGRFLLIYLYTPTYLLRGFSRADECSSRGFKHSLSFFFHLLVNMYNSCLLSLEILQDYADCSCATLYLLAEQYTTSSIVAKAYTLYILFMF